VLVKLVFNVPRSHPGEHHTPEELLNEGGASVEALKQATREQKVVYLPPGKRGP
jgi:hypothetical protein